MSDEDADKVRKSFDYINNMLLKSDPYPVTWPYEVGDSYKQKVENIMNGVEKDGFFTHEDWTPRVDNVENPNHYFLFGNYQVIDVMKKVVGDYEDLTPIQGYMYGNIIKYILRAPNKNHLEDLKKAKKYLTWLIDELEG